MHAKIMASHGIVVATAISNSKFNIWRFVVPKHKGATKIGYT